MGVANSAVLRCDHGRRPTVSHWAVTHVHGRSHGQSLKVGYTWTWSVIHGWSHMAAGSHGSHCGHANTVELATPFTMTQKDTLKRNRKYRLGVVFIYLNNYCDFVDC